jgi:hypothetical protein
VREVEEDVPGETNIGIKRGSSLKTLTWVHSDVIGDFSMGI